MKKLLHILIVVFLILSNYIILNAAPFDTGMITLTQPNDVTFTGRIWGDEFIYWMQTDDGYRFVQTVDGWFYYSMLDQYGEYVPTNYKVGIDSPPASSYQLERSQARLNEIEEQIEQFKEQIELNRQWFAQKQAEADANQEPVTLEVGIVLIEFQDVKHFEDENYRPYGYTTADFDSMMFSNNYWYATNQQYVSPHPEEEFVFGSFRDYWDQISRGKLKIEGRVANPTDENGVPIWITAKDSIEFYATTLAEDWDTLADEAITAALMNKWIDTSDENSENYFDNIVIVYADLARLAGSLMVNGGQGLGSNWIFLAERSTRKLYYGDQPSFTHIGIYAHEFGHDLGFHDEYCRNNPSTNYQTDGFPTDILNFCLMAWGIYNGPLEKGECPATLSSYYRIDKSWVTPTVLPADTNNFVVQYDYANPKFYRINPVDATNGEHFILENKKRTGFDLYIPGNPADSVYQPGRLLVWHHDVDFSYYNEFPDRITITTADNSFDTLTQLTDFFPKQFNPNSQSLNDITIPAASLGGRYSSIQDNSRPAHFALNGIQKLANGNTIINEIRLYHPLIITNQITGSWQTVSVPHILTDYSVDVVFPTRAQNSTVYKYQSGYIPVSTLENGPGYWAKFDPGNQDLVFQGVDVISYLEIPVVSGWQITGSISYPVPLPLQTNPPGIINSTIYRFDGTYQAVTDSIKPGIGYWVKTSAPGFLILDKDAQQGEIEEIRFDDMDKFIITDAEENTQTLYVSNIDIDTLIANINTEMPPLFPEIPFDSRFEYGELVKKVSADSGLVDIDILVQTNAFPVSLSWEINPDNGINYTFVGDSILGKSKTIEILSGNSSFNKLNNNKIKLLAKVDGTNTKNLLPKDYNLYQNYPNPFNPTTKIKYDLPFASEVSLIIYDILGRKVKELVNTNQQPGRYEVQFDASMLASGIYLYRIQAGDPSTSSGQSFIQTKKMILLK